MRLAISNLAWDVEEDAAVAQLIRDLEIDAIDVAPGKYFSIPANAKDQDITKVKLWWTTRGIEITGMQALLFGTSGLNVFGNHTTRRAMLDHLRQMCRIGAGLGATRLVFGSPKDRDCAGLSEHDACKIGVEFFKDLGEIAHQGGVTICLEPNPICYGANFMTTSFETAMVVNSVDHPAIRMQLDTGAIQINKENIETLLNKYAPLIGHVHASEPGLVPIGDDETDHQVFRSSIAKHLPHHLVTVEMVATRRESHLISIERALKYAVRCYRHEGK